MTAYGSKHIHICHPPGRSWPGGVGDGWGGTYVCMYLYIYIDTYVCIDIYIYIDVHTYTHTYNYMYIALYAIYRIMKI